MMKNINKNKLMIISAFIENQNNLYMREISRLSNLDIKIISRELKELLEGNILDYKFRGKIKLYSVKNNIQTQFIFSMAEMYRASVFIEKYKILRPFLNSLYKLTDFLIFGSFADGTNKKDSDLDLVIFSKKTKKLKEIFEKSPFKIHAQYIIFDEVVKIFEKGDRLSNEIKKNHILFGEFSNFIKWINYHGVSNKTKE